MPTAPTPITPYATPPSSNDPANFDARADAKVADDVIKVGEYNALATNVWGNAVEAVAAAVSADNSASQAGASQTAAAANAAAAAASAGAAAWVSGTTYAAGAVVWSPADSRIYRRRVGMGGAGTTDPSADPTNWGLSASGGLQLVAVTGTSQTAASGARYVLKNAAATTLTAPPSPQSGDEFAVKWVNGRRDNVINWNGSKHEGLSDSTLTLNASPRGSLRFIYIDAATGWGAI